MKPISRAGAEMLEQMQSARIAIVGMDAFWESCSGLDAFERSIYDGAQHFIPLPPQRWKGTKSPEPLLKEWGFESGTFPSGAYIQDFEIDAKPLKIPEGEVEKLTPEELLAVRVANRALRDARVGSGGNVAVITVTATELSIHRLGEKGRLPAETQAGLAASLISSLWNFTGPKLTLAAEENSALKAVGVAQQLLATREVNAVVVAAVDLAGEAENILLRSRWAKMNTGVHTLSYDRHANGWMVGEGAGAVVLKLHETAKQQKDRIYAVIDAISLAPKNSTSEKLDSKAQFPAAEAVAQACQQAFNLAGVKPADIKYLEVFGSGVPQEDEAEIGGLLRAYQISESELSCGLGSVKANIGHTFAASGIASLIKTALCLYHRYIPATPQWSGPKSQWQGSPFYIAPESRPWFLEKGAARRVAAINDIGLDGTCGHLILSDEPEETEPHSKYLERVPFYLFPVAAGDCSSLLEQLRALEQTVGDCPDLFAAASQTFAAFKKRSQSTYALAIVGHTKDELMREIQRAFKGVASAFERGEDWQTPAGSYFTAKPQGKRGTVAFVYPGAFNSYIGLGRNIFRLFPKVYDSAVSHLPNIGLVLREKLLYPRSLNSLSRRQLESAEKHLTDDALAMLESGICFAAFFTEIIQTYFQVRPHCTLGYSLGEISMMCAQDVWTNYDRGSENLNSSPLFSTRLSGPKNAVREFWGLPRGEEGESGDFWSAYVLMAPVSRVTEYLQHENRIYLTHINTPKEVVIAGDTQACLRAIETLKCDAFRAPGGHVLHCDAMRSEYGELVKLNVLPVKNVPETVFYSAAEYEPIALDSHSIGHNIAKGLCQQLDFPRLINRVYEDGTRIFVEAGAGSTCSRWIGETLKDREHLAVPLNKRGADDHTSIVKALAKLVSHRVSLDLSPLYCQAQESFPQSSSNFLTGTLGECCQGVPSLDTNSQLIAGLSSNFQAHSSLKALEILPRLRDSQEVKYTERDTPMKAIENGRVQNSQAKTGGELTTGSRLIELDHSGTGSQSTSEKIRAFGNLNLPEVRRKQADKLSANTCRASQSHAAFLQYRQTSLNQISQMIQLQLDASQKLIAASSLSFPAKNTHSSEIAPSIKP